MKKLLVAGLVAVLGAVSLPAILARAAVGDAVYVIGKVETPIGANGAVVRALARELAPGIATANILEIECYQTQGGPFPGTMALRSNFECTGKRSLTAAELAAKTPEEKLDARLLGERRSGVKQMGEKVVTDTAPLDAVTEAIWSLDVSAVAHFGCSRPTAGAAVTCFVFEIKTAPAATWESDDAADLVIGTIGKVE